LRDEKRFHWIEHLDDDVPGLEAGAVVDADVAAEGLAQIDGPRHRHAKISDRRTWISTEHYGIGTWEGGSEPE